MTPDTHCLDSDCDVAAIVFGPNDDPDTLLEAFADDLDWQGYNVHGFVQRGHCSARDGLELHLWPSRERLRLPECCRSAGALRTSAEFVSALQPALTSDRVDLAVVNRFGKLEAGGHGLREDITRLAHAGVPVLTAVASHRFETWNQFVGGLSVALRCRRDDLDRWWDAVSTSSRSMSTQHSTTFCQKWK